jgi:hypothetical protein
MAITQAGRLSFSIQDELGTEASITEYVLLDPLMTVGELQAAWQAQANYLDAITGGKINKGSAVLLSTNAAGKGAPVAGSRVEQTGVFNFTVGETAHRFGIAVASLADSVIAGGRITIAEGSPVDLWADSIPGDITGLAGQGYYTNPQTQRLLVLADAFLSFRKRRQLDRSSRELVTV